MKFWFVNMIALQKYGYNLLTDKLYIENKWNIWSQDLKKKDHWSLMRSISGSELSKKNVYFVSI